jgi:transposase-like protein
MGNRYTREFKIRAVRLSRHDDVTCKGVRNGESVQNRRKGSKSCYNNSVVQDASVEYQYQESEKETYNKITDDSRLPCPSRFIGIHFWPASTQFAAW